MKYVDENMTAADYREMAALDREIERGTKKVCCECDVIYTPECPDDDLCQNCKRL